MSAIAPETRIDRYAVEERVGAGGMAVVYRVRHLQLGTLHALKVLEVPSRGVQQRLLQEGRVQASMRHPNIVAVTDVISVEGAPGLVMELINGPSLDRLIQACPLTLEQADALALQILDGVEAAHDHGVVHRDLKPSNVLIQATRSGLIAKVADFGLVKVLGDGALNEYATRSGATMGTPAYMSPEQIRDAKHVDHRTDIFSLGCIFYDLVCGQRAFTGKDTLDVFRTVDESRYQPPKEVRPDLPQRMHDAIVSALQADRDARPADCAALRRAWLGQTAGAPLSRPVLSADAWPVELIEHVRSMGSSDKPALTADPPLSATPLGPEENATFGLSLSEPPRRAAETLVADSAAESEPPAHPPANLDADRPEPARGALPKAPTLLWGSAAVILLVLLAAGAGATLRGCSTEVGAPAESVRSVEVLPEIHDGTASPPQAPATIDSAEASPAEPPSSGGDSTENPAAPSASPTSVEPGAAPAPTSEGTRTATTPSVSERREPAPALRAPTREPDPITSTEPVDAAPTFGRVKLELSGQGPFTVSLFQGSEPTGQLGGTTGREIDVEPGEHTAYCTFGSDSPTQCAVLTVSAGKTHRLRCDTGLRNCKAL